MARREAAAGAGGAPPAPPRTREFLTPEGVPLTFEIPPVGDRIAAFLLDALFIVLILLGVSAVSIVLWYSGARSAAMSLFLLALFFVRNFYFAWFEIRRNGTTPGKQRLGLRVIDGRGGPLRAESVFVRNFMREVEVFLPMMLVVFGGGMAMFPGATGWQVVGALVWLLVFTLMPLFLPDRQRVGDLVGGTLVVRDSRTALRTDLASVPRAEARGRPARVHVFRPEHLAVYGIYELETLERVLRTTGAGRRQVFEAVADRIKKRIGWMGRRTDGDAESFLRDFYAAQRAHLEQRMLLGDRRERKDG